VTLKQKWRKTFFSSEVAKGCADVANASFLGRRTKAMPKLRAVERAVQMDAKNRWWDSARERQRKIPKNHQVIATTYEPALFAVAQFVAQWQGQPVHGAFEPLRLFARPGRRPRSKSLS
jgi:hypothetical protein